jgi:hypothetical protein
MTPKNGFSKLITAGVMLALALLSTPAMAGPSYSTENARRLGDTVLGTKAVTCASDGAGTAAACTLLFQGVGAVSYTCSDTDGCTMTLSELGVYDGAVVRITNVSANQMTFANSAGVLALAAGDASVTLKQYDTLSLQYKTDRWVELSRSNVPAQWSFQICGDATTVNNNTVYYGPSQVLISSATAGMRTCNTTAAGNATEATADEPALTGKAFTVTSMVCTSDNPGVASGATFTLRSAAAAVTPATACTVANGAAGSCVADIQGTVAIASGATVAVAVSSAQDVGTVKFICEIGVAF